jgi:glycosyltransferase involved in cell wall biosynthesis
MTGSASSFTKRRGDIDMTECPQPLVSVIMPVYNGAAFIQSAVESVLSQSHSNIELLIVNDGSIDATEEVVNRLMALDGRIRYSKRARSGVAAARNAALRQMRGDYFCFLDADDCFTKNSVKCRLEKFAADPELSFCDGQVLVCDEKLLPRSKWRPVARGLVFRKLLRLSSECFFGPTWLIKRDANFQYIFREGMSHAEDLFFFMEICGSGYYDFVGEDILMYRRWKGSAMKDLKGLASGYTHLYSKAVSIFRDKITLSEKIYLWFKIRKIMVLSFLAQRNVGHALLFLIAGKVK